MASPTLTIPEDDFRAWHQAVETRSDLRGAAAVAKEMESALRRAESGNVQVARHQVFGWAESLEGIAQRDALRAAAGNALSLPQVVADMRSALAGTPRAALPVAKPTAPSTSTSSTAPASAAASSSIYANAPAASTTRAAESAPPVVYARGGATGGGTAFLAPANVGDAARQIVRTAQTELLIISPWSFGLDTLVEEILKLPPSVAVRIITRRPDKDEPSYHRNMEQLTRRGAEARFSQFLQTRMIVADGARVLLGAASIPPPNAPTREAAISAHDAEVAKRAREHFARQFEDAGAPAR